MERTGDARFCVSTRGTPLGWKDGFRNIISQGSESRDAKSCVSQGENSDGWMGISCTCRGVERTGDARFCVSTRRTPLGWKDGIWGMTNKQRDTQTGMSRDAAWRTKIRDVPCQAECGRHLRLLPSSIRNVVPRPGSELFTNMRP